MQKTSIYLVLFDPFHQLMDMKSTSPVEHEKIVQWLEKKDSEQAGIEMENHLATTMNGIDVERLFPEDYLTV
jgi:hypothetical protein